MDMAQCYDIKKIAHGNDVLVEIPLIGASPIQIVRTVRLGDELKAYIQISYSQHFSW
jgi:hypothetical protein